MVHERRSCRDSSLQSCRSYKESAQIITSRAPGYCLSRASPTVHRGSYLERKTYDICNRKSRLAQGGIKEAGSKIIMGDRRALHSSGSTLQGTLRSIRSSLGSSATGCPKIPIILKKKFHVPPYIVKHLLFNTMQPCLYLQVRLKRRRLVGTEANAFPLLTPLARLSLCRIYQPMQPVLFGPSR
jgi:hypothetical protein